MQLQKEWARLQPHVHDLMRKAGEVADSSFRDFLWAYSIFWLAPLLLLSLCPLHYRCELTRRCTAAILHQKHEPISQI